MITRRVQYLLLWLRVSPSIFTIHSGFPLSRSFPKTLSTNSTKNSLHPLLKPPFSTFFCRTVQFFVVLFIVPKILENNYNRKIHSSVLGKREGHKDVLDWIFSTLNIRTFKEEQDQETKPPLCFFFYNQFFPETLT